MKSVRMFFEKRTGRQGVLTVLRTAGFCARLDGFIKSLRAEQSTAMRAPWTRDYM